MNIDQLRDILSKPGMAKSNVDLARELLYGEKPKPAVRIKQDHKPLLNCLEKAWLSRLQIDYPNETFRCQDRRYKLANGVWYKPDITCQRHKWPEENPACGYAWKETCWECKGNKGKNLARGLVMLKVAAACWPEVRWVLVWRNDEGWNEQEVLP